MLNFLRKLSFWTYDTLKGGHIKKHYNDITNLQANYSSESARKKREQYLTGLLTHATKTTPFYKEYSSFKSLNDFPLINKNLIRDNFKDFMSEEYENKKKIPVLTSGSTGTPFKLFQDQQKRYRNTASAVYYAKQSGFEIGTKLFYMKVWNDINRKSSWQMWKENIIPHGINSYTDNDFKELIEKIKSHPGKKGFNMFATTTDILGKYLDNIKSEPIDANVVSIIANSEALTAYGKASMKKYFGTYPVSRYSNMENGIIAQQLPDGSDEFHINWATYLIEILDMEKDEPAKYGEPGRVVITDLFNYCMPIIRYENGDIAVMSVEKEGDAPVISQVEGRKVDLIYDSKGKLVTSHLITVNMWKYDELKQYQFVQNGANDYSFKLNPINKFTREEELLNEFKGYLGQDANIKTEYVNDIPLLSSGKRRLVFSNYTPS